MFFPVALIFRARPFPFRKWHPHEPKNQLSSSSVLGAAPGAATEDLGQPEKQYTSLNILGFA